MSFTTLEISGTKHDFLNSRNLVRQHFLLDPEQWKRDCAGKNAGDWQHKVANEIAHSLQDLGIAVLIGIVPLKLLVAMLGDSLLLDWLIIRDFVQSQREKAGLYSLKVIGNKKLYAKRRHAEWLALITYLWLVDNWAYNSSEYTILTETIDSYGTKLAVEERIKNISKADQRLMTQTVRLDVKDLIGLNI